MDPVSAQDNTVVGQHLRVPPELVSVFSSGEVDVRDVPLARNIQLVPYEQRIVGVSPKSFSTSTDHVASDGVPSEKKEGRNNGFSVPTKLGDPPEPTA
jgi:hypothetical protein